jgi:aspartate kinase
MEAGVEVSPHFLPGLFVHLAAALPGLRWLEDFPLLEPLFEGWPHIDSDGIFESLEKGEISVIAGFQGVDEKGNITTLGRGGSDTTAVAIAAAIKADACEIYTDVDGVYTTDPNICPRAKKLDRISYEEMMELASLGAKVLQIRSVEIAMKFKVPLWVKSSFSDDPGTLVCEEDKAMEDVLVSGVALDRNEARVSVRDVPDQPGMAAKIFGALDEKAISVDLIVQNPPIKGKTDVTFTVGKADLVKTQDVMKKLVKSLKAGPIDIDDQVAKVSIVGVGAGAHEAQQRGHGLHVAQPRHVCAM